MARTVADYQVLFDGGFTLDAAGSTREKNLAFILPTNFKIEDGRWNSKTNSRVSRARPQAFTLQSQVQHTRNPDMESDRRHYARPLGPLQRVNTVPGNSRNVPFPGVPNSSLVTFIILEGKVEFGQVVIWYQVEL